MMTEKRMPEVGDVWEYHNGSPNMLITNVSDKAVYCLCCEEDEFKTFCFEKDVFIKHSKYLGHSKASIDDLFKTEVVDE